jgi:hypothetical protein
VGVSRIDVEIDRLVLRGLDPGDKHAFMTALTTELSRGLSDPVGGAKSLTSRQTAILRVRTLPVESGPSGVRKLGGRVGNAITTGIKR